MRFDSARVMERVSTFGFAREPGSDGERRAADALAERLEAAGWRVVRRQTRAGCRYLSVVMLLILSLVCQAALLWWALKASLPSAGRPVRAAWFALGFVLMGLALRLVVGRSGPRIARERFAAWHAPQGRRECVNLVADRPGPVQPPALVVILSHLDTPLPAADREDAAWSVLGLVLVVLAWIRLRPAWHAWVLVALGLAFVMFEARYWLRVRRPSPGDNRTGLAVLAELAETIPERLHERVEVRLAAVGGSMTGQLGSLTLAEEIRRRPSRPTLVINLDAPGLGPEVQLAGRGVGLELARLAARDLWIPHRVARWPLRPLDHRPFLLCKIPSVSLAGDRSGEQVRPEGLAAVAQLTTEVALRWARLQATATPAAPASQDESRDRSSQNPG